MKLGADPEFFVIDEHNNFINAYKVIPYTKKKPRTSNSGIKIFCDNVLGEFNINPANNCEEFVRSCMDARDYAKESSSKIKLCFHGYAEFDSSELTAKNAREYGCVPDFNAYTLTHKTPPEKLFTKMECRVAGGHIHVGGHNSELICNPVYKPLFTYMLDLFLAIPAVLIDNSAESFRRREYFGTAGTYRDKEYGLEYRVLSPFWLRNASTMGLVYLLCDFVYHEMNEGLYKKFYNFIPEKLKADNPETAYECWGYDSNLLRKAIDTNNFSLARKFFSFACNFMPNKLIELVEFEINNPKSLLF